MSRLVIELDGTGRGRVLVDGRALKVVRLVLAAGVDDLPRATLEIVPDEVRVLAEAEVVLQEVTPV